MMEFKPSTLAVFENSLVETGEGISVAIPSRLMLNNNLGKKLLIHDKWFYDRTFPLWATGRVSGLVFKESEGNDLPQKEGLLLGRISIKDGISREFQLIGTGRRTSQVSNAGCYKLPCSVIETLASEFCHEMGIPSAQVLCVISSNSKPDMDGSSPCAIFTRVARCYLNHGHILGAASRQDWTLVKEIFDFLVRDHFNLFETQSTITTYESLFEVLCDTVLLTVASWQAAGFYYGGLSSDTLYISGETMNFQNSGFIDTLRGDIPLFSGQTSPLADFTQQPLLAIEHCLKLYQAFQPFNDASVSAVYLRDMLERKYQKYFYASLSKKLGIYSTEENHHLVRELLTLLNKHNPSYFSIFNMLGDDDSKELLLESFHRDEHFREWLTKYHQQKIIFQMDAEDTLAWEKLNPPKPLTGEDIAQVINALHNGNRNALENCLESIQQGKPPSHFHWAS